MRRRSFPRPGALPLLVILSGCGTPPAPRRVEVTERALPISFEFTTASPPASASAIPTASSTAQTEPPPEAAAFQAFSAEQLDSLTADLKSRRVFRHVLLGRMPNHETRETWMLSKDGRQLDLVCEHGVRTPGERFPEPSRWYVLSTASFVAINPSPAQTGATQYRRDQSGATPKPFPDEERRSYRSSPAGMTACEEIGEELTLSCTPTTLPLLRPNAKMKYTRRNDDSYDIRLEPSARRTVTGLSCVFKAPEENNPFVYYAFPGPGFCPSVDTEPSLFFSNRGPAVERLVYSDSLQYATFREAVLMPFDGELPANLEGT